MQTRYTSIRNSQIILYLLKYHGIRKVIASPGTQNMSVVASMQSDPFFEMYSAPDERSAAYMACGLAAESGEPVVISCTGATASRNYVPGLTEAFYRQLPVIALTSTEELCMVGHNIAQVIDRSLQQKDICRCSVVMPGIKDEKDEWKCVIAANKALLALNHHGRGPVHINLEKYGKEDFTLTELPSCRVIERIMPNEDFPEIPEGAKVNIFIGSHVAFSEDAISAIDRFCKMYGAIVLCDHTSGYNGRFRTDCTLAASQTWHEYDEMKSDILLHFGEVSGDYALTGRAGSGAQQVWRIAEDGELKDTFRKLRYVFEMSPERFCNLMIEKKGREDNLHDKAQHRLKECEQDYKMLLSNIPNLPFSNIWIAMQSAGSVPEDSYIHFGILNSLRSWNMFKLPKSVIGSSNVGGFGIDGGISTLIGSSLAHPDRLHFGIFGDLAFFYDMNSLGNRHVGRNLRIMLINNAKGTEFRLYQHPASKLGEECDRFISAGGHYGDKSPALVKHYAEDLGLTYLSAHNKEEYLEAAEKFFSSDTSQGSMLLEIFTDSQNENDALFAINNIVKDKGQDLKNKIRGVLGDKVSGVLSSLKKKI